MTAKTISTLDEIWKLFRETREQIKNLSFELSASQKETDRQMKRFSEENAARKKELDEQLKETDHRMKETDRRMKETDRRMKETDRQIQKVGGRFNQRWGALVESLVEGKLVEALQARGINVSQTHTRSVAQWKKPDGSIQKREFDIIVANGTEVVEVEVKTTLTLKNVEIFLKRIVDFKKYFPRYKTETLYGAVAYLNSEDEANFYAEEQGLFIIKATGDSSSIVNEKNFKPKAFA